MSPVLGFILFTKTSIAARFNRNFSKPSRLILLTVGIVSVAAISLTSIVESSGWKAQLNKFKSENSFARSKDPFVATKEARTRVTVQAAGRGKPFLNLQDGRELSVKYKGDQAAVIALQNGFAQPRALASADFDRNGTPDVVAGYGYNGACMITLQRGNPDAFAPTDDSVFARMQQGYNPDSLLPGADVYAVPVSPDFMVTGNFTADSNKDVLFAAKGGALYLMAGDGSGRLGAPQEISLPGPVTGLAAGEFRAADGFTDVAVGVAGGGGNFLLIFDDAAKGFKNAVVQQPLADAATGIEFGSLDDDPYMDVAVTEGSELLIVHGWGRKELVTPESRVEKVPVGGNLRGLAVGEFAWDRNGDSEIAALSDDGLVHIVKNAKADNRPFTADETAQRTRGNLKLSKVNASVDVECMPSWKPGNAAGWTEARQFSNNSAKSLLKTNLSYRETDDLMLIGGTDGKVDIVHPDTLTAKSPSGFSTDMVSSTTTLATPR